MTEHSHQQMTNVTLEASELSYDTCSGERGIAEKKRTGGQIRRRRRRRLVRVFPCSLHAIAAAAAASLACSCIFLRATTTTTNGPSSWHFSSPLKPCHAAEDGLQAPVVAATTADFSQGKRRRRTLMEAPETDPYPRLQYRLGGKDSGLSQGIYSDDDGSIQRSMLRRRGDDLRALQTLDKPVLERAASFTIDGPRRMLPLGHEPSMPPMEKRNPTVAGNKRRWQRRTRSPRNRKRRTQKTTNDSDSASGGGTTAVHVLGNTRAFCIAFFAVLGLLVLMRLTLLALVVQHRSNTSMKLAQPTVLGIFIGAGVVVHGSCILLLSPTTDVVCTLREPLLLTPLTLMGWVLAGRIWRICLLMSPVMQVGRGGMGRGDENGEGGSSAEWSRRNAVVRQFVLDTFTCMSDWSFLCETLCGRCWRCWLKVVAKEDAMSRQRKRASIRISVPIQRLLWLVAVMMVPQLVLQVLNLSVPSMRSERTLEVDEATSLGQWKCERPLSAWPISAGDWPMWLGVALTMAPYVLTFYLAVWSSELPDAFNEAKDVIMSARMFAVVVAVAGPSYVMTESPDAKTYLSFAIVTSIVVPPCIFIVAGKLRPICRGEKAPMVSALLSRNSARGSDLLMSFSSRDFKARKTHEKSAALALTIGQMYEDVGSAEKSLKLFEDALDLWKFDPARRGKKLVGGFTVDEVLSFTPCDLEYIIKLNIAKGRVNGTLQTNDAARAWLDALEIYEYSPASVRLEDRSIIFPIFSGLAVWLKGGKIQQDKECMFEQDMVRKFVNETQAHGDPVHYTRALAMQGEVLSRLGRYGEALQAFESLRLIYIPEKHSEGISKVYGTDRSAQAYSQSALWHFQLGQNEVAVERCEYVIKSLMPKMDPANVLNSCELLLPIIRVLKYRGQAKRMGTLFDQYVVQNSHKHFGKDCSSPCVPIFKPMLMLLDLCNEDGRFNNFTESVEWALGEDNGVAPDFLNSIYTKLCWSPFSMMAEVCLRLAEKLYDGPEKSKLVAKGLYLAQRARSKMVDEEGKVTLPIAYEANEPVLLRLEELRAQLKPETRPSELDRSQSKRYDTAPSRRCLSMLPNSSVLHRGSVDGNSSVPSTVAAIAYVAKLDRPHRSRSIHMSMGIGKTTNTPETNESGVSSSLVGLAIDSQHSRSNSDDEFTSSEDTHPSTFAKMLGSQPPLGESQATVEEDHLSSDRHGPMTANLDNGVHSVDCSSGHTAFKLNKWLQRYRRT